MATDAAFDGRPPSSLKEQLSRRRPLVVFVAAYLVAWLVFGIVADRSNTVMYAGTIAVLIAIFTWLDVKVGLPGWLLWGLALLGFLHLAGGLVPVGDERILYNVQLPLHPLALDRLVHAYGAALMALVIWEVLRRDVADADPVPWSVLVAVGLAGMGTAAIEEVVEFASSRIWVTNVGGYVNTGWDLVFDLIGCAVVVFWLRRRASARDAAGARSIGS
jgi:hypothetical protein